MPTRVKKIIIGGVIATILMTMMMYFVAPMMMGQPMDIAAMLGSKMGGSWALGMIAHLMNGIVVFPLIYLFAVKKFLPGAPWIQGLGWGVILWLIVQLVVMPMMGRGVFSMAMGGMPAVMASLVGHLVYGGVLGGVGDRE